MSLVTWIQSLFAVVADPKSTAGKEDAYIRTSSLHGKSASEITSELARRGDGSMAAGITRTAQNAYWQGRTTQRNIEKDPNR